MVSVVSGVPRGRVWQRGAAARSSRAGAEARRAHAAAGAAADARGEVRLQAVSRVSQQQQHWRQTLVTNPEAVGFLFWGATCLTNSSESTPSESTSKTCRDCFIASSAPATAEKRPADHRSGPPSSSNRMRNHEDVSPEEERRQSFPDGLVERYLSRIQMSGKISSGRPFV